MNNQNKKITTLTKKVNNLSRRLQQNAPVAINRVSGSAAQRSVKSLSLRQTERIGTVMANGSPNFALASYNINPGTMFPWLSQHARLYDKYKFRSLKFTFKTAVPTNTPGNVGIGVDYDVLDAEPVDAIEFSQLASWSAQSVWKNFSTSVDVKKPLWDYLFNRSYIIGGADLKTYDIGKLLVYTEGVNLNAGDTIGYLEATYDIELLDKTPVTSNGVLTASLMSAVRNNTWYCSNNGQSSGSAVSLAASKYGDLQTLGESNKYVVNNLSLPTGTVMGVGTYSTPSASLGKFKSIPLDRGIYSVTINIDDTSGAALPSDIAYELYACDFVNSTPSNIELVTTGDSTGFITAVVFVENNTYLQVLLHNTGSSSVTLSKYLMVRDFIIRKL